jgi:selenocysteine lyase/cysteine desulfurase
VSAPLDAGAARAAFMPPDGRYFLSHSIGLPPARLKAAAGAGFFDPWAKGDGAAWDRWLAALDRFGASLAPLIGAAPAEICPQANLSSAFTKILFSLPERARRRKIVLTEDDFPTMGFVAAQARRIGYEVLFLPGGARLADIAAWSPAFHEDVQLVLATHVFSNSGVRAPVGEIAARAHARGVFSVLDIAQSAGVVDVDLAALKPDFAVGTALKYLCGGPGAAFLWTGAETAARCAPLDVGWFSHERPFDFDIRDFRYAPGAARFLGGTPSIAPFANARAGADEIARFGVGAIEAHAQRLLGRLIDALPQGALLSHGKPGARGAHAIIAVADGDAASAALDAQKVRHDRRMGGLRFSFHLYNDDSDVDALLAALEPHL